MQDIQNEITDSDQAPDSSAPSSTAASDLEKMRQQYENLPYPANSIDAHPRKEYNNLDNFFIHSLVTPYYLRHQKVVNTTDKVILDAGCGSGFKALMLAEANPGAKIVGVDLSPESVKLARQRLAHHKIENFEFHAMLLENVQGLGMQFDYINCDEVLYLLPDPIKGLNTLMSVLKPDGIIRTNLHSALSRHNIYRAQALAKMMGLMDENPTDMEVDVLRETMASLQDFVDLKTKVWNNTFAKEGGEAHILMNHLLLGDRGFTVPEMFEMLQVTDAEFIGMTNWRHWELMNLFKDAKRIPTLWEFALPDLSAEEQLRIFELLHPAHRLLDFWCGKPQSSQQPKLVGAWSEEEWSQSTVYLHPVLQTNDVKEALVHAIHHHQHFDFSRYIGLPTLTSVNIESLQGAALLPLWDGPQSIDTLVKRYLRICPVNPETLEPINIAKSFQEIKKLLSKLETYFYVLLETHEST
ncbi:MAG: class I SAM-dependent methyltransferase [Cyanobacteria bacterium P01_A01_bin.37]